MKHLIIVKWNELVTNKKSMLEKVYEAFKDVTKIEGVTDLKIIESCSERPNRYDVIIEVECSEEGLKLYDDSTLHKAWKENYSKYIGAKAIFDTKDVL